LAERNLRRIPRDHVQFILCLLGLFLGILRCLNAKEVRARQKAWEGCRARIAQNFPIYAPEAAGARTLQWELNFLGEVLDEARDYLCVELSGNALLPIAGGGQLPGIEPCGAFGPTEAGPSARLPARGEACAALLSGAPLVCSLCVSFQSMGQEQPVRPLRQDCEALS